MTIPLFNVRAQYEPVLAELTHRLAEVVDSGTFILGPNVRAFEREAAAYLGVTAVSVLMGAVHLPTGLVVQAVMTLAAVVGILLYRRRPRLERKLLGMGLPERLAADWAAAFPQGFALALAAVSEEHLDATQDAFLDDPGFTALLAVDRRPVL